MSAAPRVDPLQPPRWLRWALTALAVLIMAFLLVMPLAMVLGAAFQEGVKVWFAALTEPDARSALELTLITAAVVIPLNAFFGMATAWAVTRFEFRGKRILLALIDLPFAVSPVVAGLCLVLLFGRDGWFAPLPRSLRPARSCSRGRPSSSRRCSSPSRSSRAS